MNQDPRQFLIWSHEHGGWWGPNHRGYVQRAEDAGRYSLEEAANIVADHYPPGEQVAVLASLANNPRTVDGLRARTNRALQALTRDRDAWKREAESLLVDVESIADRIKRAVGFSQR